MRLITVLFMVLFLSLSFSVVDAREFYEEEEGKFALGIKAGTLGAGIEGIMRLNSNFNAKLGVNAFQYDYSGTEDGIEYDFDLELFSVSALLDWHPFKNSFRITSGALYNQNSLDMNAKTASSYTIGSATYTAAQVGSLTGELDFDEVNPYLGIGWGNAVGKNKQWSFSFDIGVVYQGSPKVDLSANGTLSGNAAFQANLDREEQNLEDELEDYQFYPVISLGVCYSF
ncbi:MAG: hypothetical protein KKH80_01080 [Candidatus Omnitrophica bacterium]|nr:hypothetical protein [Candidatus Omnitrophota bacterium]MBU1871381.1 hypothetical protein [Candidatus Omnitrophota bacterium]